MNARLVLMAGLMLATLGMASIVFGVVVPGLFFPGVYLLDAAVVVLIVAGVMHLAAAPRDPAV
jgi:hypothetical protein